MIFNSNVENKNLFSIISDTKIIKLYEMNETCAAIGKPENFPAQ